MMTREQGSMFVSGMAVFCALVGWGLAVWTVAAPTTDHAPEVVAAANVDHVRNMRADGTISNVVRQLCAEGEVCRIVGHAWRDGRPGEGNGGWFADYHPGTSYRTCRICGATQTQTTLEWR
jgi:hypothetical protein